jgi:predicted nucleic acid-binding protein
VGAIFIDTSAWVALYVEADRHHAESVRLWQEIRKSGVIAVSSFDVLGETLTVIRRKADLNQAVAFGRAFWESLSLSREASEAPVRQLAWELFQKHGAQDLSFVDCLSFALMEHRGIRHAFTFDNDFRDMGFTVNEIPAP